MDKECQKKLCALESSWQKSQIPKPKNFVSLWQNNHNEYRD